MKMNTTFEKILTKKFKRKSKEDEDFGTKVIKLVKTKKMTRL
jgi:hypothetical protein